MYYPINYRPDSKKTEKDKDEVNKEELNKYFKKLDEIDSKLIKIDEEIINGTYDRNENKNKFYNIKKDVLIIKTYIIENRLKDEILPELKTKLEEITKNIEIIDEFLIFDTQIGINDSVDYLSILNLLLFPLSIVISIFGTNFKKFDDIYSTDRPFLFIFFMYCCISVLMIVCVIIYKKYIM
tara:strand:- start:126 stop:671 length:546 start_codon:yes stop_codon:yes gene_type:complete